MRTKLTKIKKQNERDFDAVIFKCRSFNQTVLTSQQSKNTPRPTGVEFVFIMEIYANKVGDVCGKFQRVSWSRDKVVYLLLRICFQSYFAHFAITLFPPPTKVGGEFIEPSL